MCPRRRSKLFRLVLAALWAALPVDASVFDCDEGGLDGAIEAADGGDPGPHTFDCSAEAPPVVTTRSRRIASDLMLDGGGRLAIECLPLEPSDPRSTRCDPLFRIGSVCAPARRHCRGLPPPPNSAVELRDLTIVGAGVDVQRAHLTLHSVEITGAKSLDPGKGAITVLTPGDLSLIDSTISGNDFPDALGAGGGVWILSGHARIEGSTITDNRPFGLSLSSSGTAIVLNSTISGNGDSRSLSPSGEIRNGGLLRLIHSTIVAGGGRAYDDLAVIRCPGDEALPPFLASVGTAIVESSIIAGECSVGEHLPLPPPLECSLGLAPGTLTSGGGNLESPGDHCGLTHGTDHVAVPRAVLGLGGLADNGGPTETHALLQASPALDAAILAKCPPADQRGVDRPQGVHCDAGAFERIVSPRVEIRIRSGGPLNPRRLSSRGVIPVAILGSVDFDVRDVEPTSLAFGPRGAAPAHRLGGHPANVDDDGVLDLVSHYRARETGIGPEDTEACVRGTLLDGTPFLGCDDVRTAPPGAQQRGRRPWDPGTLQSSP